MTTNRIELLGDIPDTMYIAVSGGVDSMAALHFFTHTKKRNVIALHFNHGTTYGVHAQQLVETYCKENNIEYILGKNETGKSDYSEEEFRLMRYKFFEVYNDRPLVMCHTLDDQLETWIFYASRGNPKLIPYKRELNQNDILRPFLITKKEALYSWAKRKNVPYLEDPTNHGVDYARCRIRNNVIPELLKVNPGMHKTIKKKVIEEYEELHS